MVSGPPLNPEVCVICKGTRLMCGRRECPLLIKQMAMLPLQRIKLSADIEGASPPSFFVGRQNYPRVLVGPMIPVVPEKDTQIYDEPDLWYGRSVTDLVRYRTSLIRTNFSINVRKPTRSDSRLLDVAQEMVMASNPVATEAQLSKRPEYRIDFDSLNAPMGPRGILERISITENPSIPTFVDRVVGDTDLKATMAISNLYQNGLTVTQIQRLLSAGLLGIHKRRRLVPTRWSITATDDTISKAMIQKIKDYPELSEYQIFESNYLDNYFVAIVIPRTWLFEQLETWHPGSPWIESQQRYIIVQDHEFYEGRKNYASRTAGAYYAARLALVEYLCRIRRQAGAIIFREVRPGYLFAMGVWQIRENLRHAFNEPPKVKDSLSSALEYVGSKMLTPLKVWLATSKIYDYLSKQVTLEKYIKLKKMNKRQRS